MQVILLLYPFFPTVNDDNFQFQCYLCIWIVLNFNTLWYCSGKEGELSQEDDYLLSNPYHLVMLLTRLIYDFEIDYHSTVYFSLGRLLIVFFMHFSLAVCIMQLVSLFAWCCWDISCCNVLLIFLVEGVVESVIHCVSKMSNFFSRSGFDWAV